MQLYPLWQVEWTKYDDDEWTTSKCDDDDDDY